MPDKQIIGLIISLLCCWGSAFIFTAIGLHADKSKRPINFWAGQEVDSSKLSDISAYNHANAVMWKCYSVPFWVAGILFSLDNISDVFSIIATVILFLAFFPGLVILIRTYKNIERNYLKTNASH